MKRIQLFLSAVALAVSASQGANAQDAAPKPALVISISSYDKLLANLELVGEIGLRKNYPDKFAEVMAKLTDTDPIPLSSLPGVEKGKPWGMVAMNDNDELHFVVFIPTTSVEELLDGLSPLLGEKKVLEDGLFEVQGLSSPLLPVSIGNFVKASDGWAFFGESPEALENLPDPDTVLGDLPSKYDIGIRLDMESVPESFREFSLDDLPIPLPLPGLGSGGLGSQQPTDGIASTLQQFQESVSGQLRDDLSTVTIGVTLDTSTKKLTIDALLTPKPDSPSAKHLQAMKNVESRFSELAKSDDTRMTFNLTGPLPDSHAKDLRGMLQSYRESVAQSIDESDEVLGDEERGIFRELSDGLVDVLQSSVDGGKLDVAFRARMFEESLHMVAAVRITDGAKMEALVRKFAEYAKDDPGFRSVELDVAEHNGTAIHAFTFPTPKKDKDADPDIIADFMGMFDKRTVHVAVTDDAFWVAMGPKAVTELKTAMDGPTGGVKPIQFRVSIARWFTLLIPQAPEAMRLPMSMVMGPSLRMHGDDLIMTAEATDEGFRVKATADTGYVNVGRIILGFLPNILQGGFGGR